MFVAMLDLLTTAEIQALRLQLHHFGSQQQDPDVKFHCFIVETNLAEALVGDDPMLRDALVSSVAELERALGRARLADLTASGADQAARLTTPKPPASMINPNYPRIAWMTPSYLLDDSRPPALPAQDAAPLILAKPGTDQFLIFSQ
jgi:hypothetical protein